MNFVAIDLEINGFGEESICSIGIAEVKNNSITAAKEYFIELSINETNKSNFSAVWKEIKPLLESNKIAAFNANSKMKLLLNTLEKYEFIPPTLNFFCSRFIAKKLWRKLENYKIETIADHLNISITSNSIKDNAIIASKILLNAMENSDVTTIEELHKDLELTTGYMEAKSFIPVARKLSGKKQKHPFYSKNVVFTGTLRTMVRSEAMKKVRYAGGCSSGIVNKNTDILVVGTQSIAKLRGKTKSSKMLKAERLKEEGKDILIITEEEFLKIL